MKTTKNNKKHDRDAAFAASKKGQATVRNPTTQPPAKPHFAEVFLKALPSLRKVVTRIMLSNQDTDDLLQEAFVRGLSASRRSDIHSLEDYLFVVARNLALKERTKQQNNLGNVLSELELDTLESRAPSPEESVYNRNRFNAFIQAANTLPEQCQRAFLLKHVHGCSQKEIAKIMKITESTVEKHIAKGLRRCANELEKLDYLKQRKASTRALAAEV